MNIHTDIYEDETTKIVYYRVLTFNLGYKKYQKNPKSLELIESYNFRPNVAKELNSILRALNEYPERPSRISAAREWYEDLERFFGEHTEKPPVSPAAENKETRRENQRKYRSENKEKYNEYQREYMQKYNSENKETRREYYKKYYYENKENRRDSQRKWVQKNREKINEYHKKWQAENKEKTNEYARNHYAKIKAEKETEK